MITIDFYNMNFNSAQNLYLNIKIFLELPLCVWIKKHLFQVFTAVSGALLLGKPAHAPSLTEKYSESLFYEERRQMLQIQNDVKKKFRLLTSMEQILIPNFSLCIRITMIWTVRKVYFEREKCVTINIIEQAIFLVSCYPTWLLYFWCYVR